MLTCSNHLNIVQDVYTRKVSTKKKILKLESNQIVSFDLGLYWIIDLTPHKQCPQSTNKH